MSESRLRSRLRPLPTRATAAGVVVAALAVAGLTACQADDSGAAVASGGTTEPSPSATVAPVLVSANVDKGASDVPVDKTIKVTAKGGKIKSVTLSSKAGKVDGDLNANQTGWKATGRLEPGASYVVKTDAIRSDGKQVIRRSRFSTENLTLDQQTYPSVAPLNGETVGVGMPVIVTFDVAVTDHASFQKHMSITTTPSQPGSWHWMSDNEVHWRPKTYWKPGTDVQVKVDVNSVPAGNGIYGQEDRDVNFHVGDAHIYKVNMVTDQMKVFSNGNLLRTIPITTGQQPKFTTRSGVKVIIEKFDSKRMNSETIGIPVNSADGYNLDNVQWAMRVTYSGEFIHAAPWSVASQGNSNVSHGCTGMSTANADWLYHMSRRGDVVEYTGTDKQMTLDNGYGDWNESFAQYRQGSALS